MDYILNRRSVREFDLTKKISLADLKLLCKYAEAAPSARNQRGREYIIVDDQDVINKLATVSKGSMVLSRCNTLIAVIGKPLESLATPHMLTQDLACAVENILLKATEMGYGSCYIGINPLEERIVSCDEILGVTGGAHTFALIALGYCNKKEFYDKDKFDEGVLHYNRY